MMDLMTAEELLTHLERVEVSQVPTEPFPVKVHSYEQLIKHASTVKELESEAKKYLPVKKVISTLTPETAEIVNTTLPTTNEFARFTYHTPKTRTSEPIW